MQTRGKPNNLLATIEPEYGQSCILACQDQTELKSEEPKTLQYLKRRCKRSELKVLIVEDNEINQRLAQIMLKKLGIESTIACDGQIAIDMTMEQDYDVLFMDIKMPRVDGIAATEAILKNHERPNPVIIAMTANIFEQEILRYHEVGMLHVVSKPFKIADFSEALDKFFSLDDIPAR